MPLVIDYIFHFPKWLQNHPVFSVIRVPCHNHKQLIVAKHDSTSIGTPLQVTHGDACWAKLKAVPLQYPNPTYTVAQTKGCVQLAVMVMLSTGCYSDAVNCNINVCTGSVKTLIWNLLCFTLLPTSLEPMPGFNICLNQFPSQEPPMAPVRYQWVEKKVCYFKIHGWRGRYVKVFKY